MNDIDTLMTLAKKFEKAAESGRGAKTEQKNNTAEGVKNYITYTKDNRPVFLIEDNILNGVAKKDWVRCVKNAISEKISNGIPIKGRLIKVNRITKNEYTNSKDSQRQKRYNKTIYKDKYKSSNNLDEIILASTNYVNEDLKHQRKDNFKEFARGDVLIRVGNNDYSANVIVGITSSNNMVLYDVIDFTPKRLNIKKEGTHTVQQQINAENDSTGVPSKESTPYGQQKESIRSGMISNKTISHKGDNVNNNSMRENENNADRVKYFF